MFADFLKRLIQPAPEPLTGGDARLALCALLVRVARTDGDYAAAEIIRITRIISARYNLPQPEAEALRQQAEVLESEADGVREADEDALLRLVASLLGITDQDSARARQRIMGQG